MSLKKVFDKLRSANLKLELDKCEVLKKETEKISRSHYYDRRYKTKP